MAYCALFSPRSTKFDWVSGYVAGASRTQWNHLGNACKIRTINAQQVHVNLSLNFIVCDFSENGRVSRALSSYCEIRIHVGAVKNGNIANLPHQEVPVRCRTVNKGQCISLSSARSTQCQAFVRRRRRRRYESRGGKRRLPFGYNALQCIDESVPSPFGEI